MTCPLSRLYLQLTEHAPPPSSYPVSKDLRSCISRRITRVIHLPAAHLAVDDRLACYSLQLVCGAVRRFRENCFFLFGGMHGLVFRRSIHYWQDQPGSQHTHVRRFPFNRPCPSEHQLLPRRTPRGPLGRRVRGPAVREVSRRVVGRARGFDPPWPCTVTHFLPPKADISLSVPWHTGFAVLWTNTREGTGPDRCLSFRG
jgi:hypothetical protein